MRTGEVVMKAHSNKFMPEFSVSGKGGISMENDFQDNNFGARKKSCDGKSGKHNKQHPYRSVL